MTRGRRASAKAVGSAWLRALEPLEVRWTMLMTCYLSVCSFLPQKCPNVLFRERLNSSLCSQFKRRLPWNGELGSRGVAVEGLCLPTSEELRCQSPCIIRTHSASQGCCDASEVMSLPFVWKPNNPKPQILQPAIGESRCPADVERDDAPLVPGSSKKVASAQAAAGLGGLHV